MKRIVIYAMSLCVIFALSQNISAQPDWKKLKDKAKGAVKKKDETKTVTNPTTTSGNQNVTTNQGLETAPDEDLAAWFDVKYRIAEREEYYFSKGYMEKGTIDTEKQLEGAKLLDYPNTLKILEEKKVKVAATINAEKIKIFKEFEQRFTDAYQKTYKPFINQEIEKAYSKAKVNEGEVLVALTGAKELMEAVILIIPGNSDAQALKSDVDKAEEALLKPYYAKVYTSDFHKQNVGKILFSDKPIKIGKEDPAQFKTSFGPNDKIYAVAYLDKRFRDYKGGFGGSDGEYAIFIDGNSAGGVGFSHNEGDELLSYYLIEIIPDPNTAFHSLDPAEFGKVLSILSPRKHDMELGYGRQYSPNYAKGQITLEYAGFDGTKIKANNDLAAKNAQTNWDKNRQLPDYVKDPQNKFTSTELSEANMKKAILDRYGKEGALQVIKIFQFKKEVPEDWYISKNSLGIITEKSTHGVVLAVYKAKDGWCYYVPHIKFKKEYLAGKWGILEIFIPGQPTRFDCKNCQ